MRDYDEELAAIADGHGEYGSMAGIVMSAAARTTDMLERARRFAEAAIAADSGGSAEARVFCNAVDTVMSMFEHVEEEARSVLDMTDMFARQLGFRRDWKTPAVWRRIEDETEDM